jgi:hypothetical protein
VSDPLCRRSAETKSAAVLARSFPRAHREARGQQSHASQRHHQSLGVQALVVSVLKSEATCANYRHRQFLCTSIFKVLPMARILIRKVRRWSQPICFVAPDRRSANFLGVLFRRLQKLTRCARQVCREQPVTNP